ncbi:serine/threonine-protein kinase [Actinomadura bangladeshensis]|uniref:serine/threonine-protein kinase n=1 Tax=Actinomadura bangladeshensis TaxID=453573 RepID=UPI0023B30801|nr:serine/threonine-protein kinase [Actinomadura bangladeshensis]
MNGDRLIPLARRYRLLSVVGRGGMGTVWRAYDEMLDRDVAVKEVHLPPRITQSERRVMCRRLLAEARATAALRHPGVVAVHDLIIEDGRPWIVMEFLESCSLNRLVTEDGPLGVRRTAEIGAAVLSVLRASHAAGILHRDVKPSNVLICDDGRVLLSDFGLAVHMHDGRELADTMPAGIEGSPAYLPPERVDGQPSVEASDLWSLGATLYTAVEGFSPFLRCHALASMMAVLLGDYARPVRAGPLTAVIEGLLRQRPEDRLTAEATADLLRDVVGSLPEPGITRATLPKEPRVPARRVMRGPRVPWTLHSGSRHSGSGRSGSDGTPPRGSPRTRTGRRYRVPWTKQAMAARPRRPLGRPFKGRRLRPGAVVSVAALAVLAAGAGTWAARWTSIGKSEAVALRPAAGVTVKTAKYHETGAYSVRVPVGWQAERSGGVMTWKDAGSERGLRIAPAPGDALAGLRAEEHRAVKGHRFPGYHRLRLEPVPEVIAGAAEWEFTWRDGRHTGGEDGLRHVLCSRAAGYEFCFYAPDPAWTPGQRLYDKILKSFRPEKTG